MEDIVFERACIVKVKIHGFSETVFEDGLHAYHQTLAERAKGFHIEIDLDQAHYG